MNDRANLQRYSLYGENLVDIAPEFLHIEPISTRSRLYDWSILPHTHPGIHQLLLLERGSGLLVADGVEAELAPCCLVAIPSHRVHGFRFDAASEGWICSFATELLHDRRLNAFGGPGAFGRRGTSIASIEPGSRNLARLQWVFGEIAEDLGKHPRRNMRHRLLAQLSLLLVLADELLDKSAHMQALGRKDGLALSFCELVDARYEQGWSVADLARELGTTAPTLNRACRAVLNKPPGAVVHDRLLLEAMRHLTYTSASISQISGNLGFNDPAYFARFFRTKTGMTATRFRKERVWLADTDMPHPGEPVS